MAQAAATVRRRHRSGAGLAGGPNRRDFERAWTRAIAWIGAAMVVVTIITASYMDQTASTVDVPRVRIYGGAEEQITLGRWAVRRFEAGGLEFPEVEIHFHADLSGCSGHLGVATPGRVDVCTLSVDPASRHAVLHELGHVWLVVNTVQALRDRFLRLRGLSDWNEGSDPWELRGYEQAAEIIAWTLGERVVTPKIPDNDPAFLAIAFELLTGVETPTPEDPPYVGGSKGVTRGAPPLIAPAFAASVGRSR
jgi:hypothetical protein